MFPTELPILQTIVPVPEEAPTPVGFTLPMAAG
jgi:hypothetical protein